MTKNRGFKRLIIMLLIMPIFFGFTQQSNLEQDLSLKKNAAVEMSSFDLITDVNFANNERTIDIAYTQLNAYLKSNDAISNLTSGKESLVFASEVNNATTTISAPEIGRYINNCLSFGTRGSPFRNSDSKLNIMVAAEENVFQVSRNDIYMDITAVQDLSIYEKTIMSMFDNSMTSHLLMVRNTSPPSATLTESNKNDDASDLALKYNVTSFSGETEVVAIVYTADVVGVATASATLQSQATLTPLMYSPVLGDCEVFAICDDIAGDINNFSSNLNVINLQDTQKSDYLQQLMLQDAPTTTIFKATDQNIADNRDDSLQLSELNINVNTDGQRHIQPTYSADVTSLTASYLVPDNYMLKIGDIDGVVNTLTAAPDNNQTGIAFAYSGFNAQTGTDMFRSVNSQLKNNSRSYEDEEIDDSDFTKGIYYLSVNDETDNKFQNVVIQ